MHSNKFIENFFCDSKETFQNVKMIS